MRNFPLVSIVVPSFNRKELINPCLKSLMATRYPTYEIIVVDDGSTDGAREMLLGLSRKYKNLRVLYNEKNNGPSITRNKGVNDSKGKYVVFFETDMQASPLWISQMVRVLEKNPRIGACHSRVFDLKRKEYIQADGMLLIPHTGWVVMRNYGLKVDQADDSIVDVVIGSVGTIVRKSILDKIGGFDEKLGHKVDDIDLGWRIWIAGFRSVCVPQAVTYHWGGKPQTARPISTLKAEYYFNKMPAVFIKNYEWSNLIRYLPFATTVYFLRAVMHLIKNRNPRPLLGFLKAWVWVLTNLGYLLTQRALIQSNRKYSDKYIFKKIMVKGNFFQTWRKYTVPIHHMAHTVFAK